MKRIKGLFVLGIIVLGIFGTSKTAQGEGNLFSVGSEQELNDALVLIQSGDTIKLTADIEYAGDIVIDGKSITFDLGGYKLNVNSNFIGLSVNNSGAVQLANEGELNIIGSIFGVWADNGSNAVVTNVSLTADSGTAVYAGIDCTVLVKGSVAVKGDNSTGILINSGAGVTIDNDVTVNGTNCTGITSQIKGDITVKGNIAVYGNYCTAVSAYDSITTLNIMGNITAEGDNGRGIFTGGSGGIINAGGDISGKGLYFNGVYNTGSNIQINGSVKVNGEESNGIFSMGGNITLEGDAVADGTGCYGANISGGSVEIKGSIRVSGDPSAVGRRTTGVTVAGVGTLVNIRQNVNATGRECFAVISWDNGKTIVAGNITAEGSSSYGLSVSNNGTAEITGSTTVTGNSGCGASTRTGNIIIGSDVTVTGDYGKGVNAEGGSIKVNGNIKVTGYDGSGAIALMGGLATVEGWIEATKYIITGTTIRQISNGVSGTGAYTDYLQYSSGSSIVRVRKHIYTVSYLANGGTGTAPASAAVNLGFTYRIAANSFTAPAGMKFKEWNVDPLGSGKSYTANGNITMPADNLTLYAIWSFQSYNITVQNDGNGTASASTSTATMGQAINLSAVPKSGYRLKEWQSISPSGLTFTGNSFLMPASAVTVKAIFEKTYSVTLQSSDNGTASADITVAGKGDTVTLTAVPNSHYHLKEWQVITPTSLTLTGNSFVMPDVAVIIKAIFEKDTYSITIQDDGRGTGEASQASAKQGEIVTLTAKPDAHYHLKEWQIITPTSLTLTGNSFEMPEEAVIIKAIFEKDTYSITVQNSTGGTANASLSRAEQGQTVTLSATAENNYHLKEWEIVTPTSLTLTGNSFEMPEEKVIIKAIFEKNTYPITVQNSTGGTANASISRAEQGQKVALTATPDNSYRLKEWQIITPANLTLTGNSFEMPEEEVIIKAIFEKQLPAIDDNAPSNNTIGSNNQSKEASDALDLPIEESFVIIGTTGGNGTISATITGGSVSEALEAAKEKMTENEAGPIDIDLAAFLDLSGAEEITSLNLVLTREAIQSMLQDKVDSLKINGGILSIRLDAEVLSEIYHSSSGDVTISIAPNSKLSFTDGERASFRAVYDIDISYGSSGDINQITNMKQGTMLISIPYALKEGEDTSELFAVYINHAGESNLIQNSYYDRLSKCVIFTTNHLSTYGIVYREAHIKLTDTNHSWGKESIDFVVKRGLISGTGASTFSPERALTREVLAKALAVLSGANISQYRSGSFDDVASDSDYMPYIEWAYAQGIMNQKGEKQFTPTKSVTREELAIILVNFARATSFEIPNVRESYSFTDLSKLSSDAGGSVSKVTQAGIMAEKKAGYFNPMDEVSRTDAAVILHRYFMLTINKQSTQGWSQNDKGQRIYYLEGKRFVGWQVIEGRKYYFNNTGILKEGWIKDGPDKYYQTAEGVVIGWWKKGGKRYYFSKNGTMVYGKWVRINKKWYYFYEDGTLAVNTNIDGFPVDKNGIRGDSKRLKK